MASICEGEFDIGCSSYQRTLIDALNIVFLSVYFVALIVSLLTSTWNNSNGRSRKNHLFFVVSVCCVGVGVVYITFFAWITLSGKGRAIAPSASPVYIGRGIIWMFISISLNFHPTKWTRILSAVWWVGFSLLVSALNVRILIEEHILEALEIASWVANLLLLVCGIKLFQEMFGKDPTNEILEPLLTDEKHLKAKKVIGLSDIGFFSKLSFSWLNPLLRSGYRKPLSLSDIPDLDPEDSAGLAYSTFTREWELQKKSHKTKNLSLFSLGQCYKKEMLLVGLYATLKTIAVVVAPLLIYSFIQYSNREDRKPREGLVLVGCLMTAKIVESLSQRHWFFNSRRYGMRMRSGMMAAVFRKLLNISTLGRKEHSTGEIVNYIAVDAYRLGEFPWWFHMAWSLPIQMLLSVVILFCVAGSGAALGMIPLVICGLLNIPFAKMLQNSQYQFMVGQDERLRATSQILNNMKVIKLQSWEDHFHKMVESLREVEFKWLREAQMKKSYTTALYWMSPTIISAVIFAGCAVMGSAPLNSSTIFTVLATMRVLAEPVRMFPEVLSVMIQLKVSLDRLDVFLLEDDLKEDNAKRINKSHKGEECVRIENGVFSWDLDKAANVTLKNLDLQIMQGHKIAVCGHVGASKSSLLFAVLGEIPRVSGNVEVYGTIAYVSQTSWIQGGTVQDNILYGKSMDKKRYERAIKVCALDKDIEKFDHGDLTEIGQRGLNLSGGQKQRVQLARAVYSDADIYLLDDPFSAVDAHTAAILFNDCVMSALRDKTVILVTHQIEFLPEMDKILVMEDGKVNQSGSYEELLKAGTMLEQLVDAHQSTMAIVDPSNHEIQEVVLQNVVDTRPGAAKQQSEADISVNTTFADQLTEEEEKEIGDSGWKAYIDYIRISKNYFQMFAVVFFQFTFISLQMLSTYWLAIAVEIPNVGSGLLIGAYAVISTISCMFVHLRSVVGAVLGLRASKAFFTGFMDSVFKAPMLFFDSTPVGRILIRASLDMSILDFDISFSIAYVVAAFIDVAGTIIIMTFVTWQILIAYIPVFIAMHYVQKYYLVSARELVRINGTTKAPVMNYVTETSFGVTTIRAFNAAEQFITNNLKLIDTDAKLYFHTIGAMEWLLIRVETLQNLTIFTAATLLVLLPNNSIAPGLVGLSLSYALTLTNAQVFLTRWFSSLDNYIISVERIKQFMYLASEAPAIINNNRPPSSWPHKGRIDLQDLKIKYRPNAPLVLKGITCTLAPGEKIGVVGRTGSGKSTLISALFRLVEPTEGRIIIDKLNISSIGLKDLRMKLSIIPQDPTLFRGSVRKNIDPLGLHTDHEIWEALDKCQLKNTISNLPNLLDSSVSDEGENWSVGQRQLFCLGRVLLRRNKILVLDEATASIDATTDATLQRIIRQEFASCTVVTVAHRVPTIMDSDMVMVLSYGNLLEYDKPSNLMGTNSSFSKLVAEYWSNCSSKSFQNLLNV